MSSQEERIVRVQKLKRKDGTDLVMSAFGLGQLYRVLSVSPVIMPIRWFRGKTRYFKKGNYLFDTGLEQLRQNGVAVEIVERQISWICPSEGQKGVLAEM